MVRISIPSMAILTFLSLDLSRKYSALEIDSDDSMKSKKPIAPHLCGLDSKSENDLALHMGKYQQLRDESNH
uniref:AlNc14C43G3560 protein n=1 Tax=Albugo laibachii Nc14 TaxID=890382 RepID=F0WA16_9STRA|nr:AlNc14C43G3560 [Albugo laibachii Nc14]CCA27730.1 AlNc14C656G12346 [Albugo laibachii Nc14]|eukprot:CCA27730.1 AlNc14C656G12346 [Albugo laibachii Nc14]